MATSRKKITPETAPDFDGSPVAAMEMEITGGGTHDCHLVIGNGDLVEIVVLARAVNVKHPGKAGAQKRLHTLNVEDAHVVSIVEKYVEPIPDPELFDESGKPKDGDDDGNVTPIK